MIAIICAMKEELNEIICLMKDFICEQTYCNKFYIGSINNIRCILSLCGVGKVNAAICTQTLIINYKPDIILNVGVAGAIDEKLKIGDVVIANTTIQHDFDISAFAHRKKGEIPGIEKIEVTTTPSVTEKLTKCSQALKRFNFNCGKILTGDQFISSTHKLKQLQKEFGGLACDMEAASIAQTCYLNHIKFGIVRAISDCADNTSPVDFKSFIKSSSKNAAMLINDFTKSIWD